MDPSTPKRQSASDDFTAVKRLPDEDRPTQVTAAIEDADPTKLSISPAPPPPRGELTRGTKVGDYIIEEKVGQGGMGEVYRAVHPVIGKAAAVKVLNSDLNADQYNLERFTDEARVVNTIGHPNIVDVFAFGETDDGRRFLIMEWLRGETLRERLERDPPMTLVEISDVVRPLTRALMAAHDKGVIHRDLKPDNVFLVENRGDVPIVKLCDFGIAKPASTTHRVAKTATGAIVGTPLYIAPEQAKGREIDSGVDIYALGCILFELISQRPPFLADNAMEIVAKHLMEAPPRPSIYTRGVPQALDDLVLAMLAKEPMQRPLLPAVLKVLEALRDQRRPPTEHPDDQKTQLVIDPAPRYQTPVPMIIQSSTRPATEDRELRAAAAVSIPPRKQLDVPLSVPMEDRVTSQVRTPGLPWRIIGPVAAGLTVIVILIIALGGGGDIKAPESTPAPVAPEATQPAARPEPRPTAHPIDEPKPEVKSEVKPEDIEMTPPVATSKPPIAAPAIRKQPPKKQPEPPKKQPDPKKTVKPDEGSQEPTVRPKKPDPPKKPQPKLDENGLFEPGSFKPSR